MLPLQLVAQPLLPSICADISRCLLAWSAHSCWTSNHTTFRLRLRRVRSWHQRTEDVRRFERSVGRSGRRVALRSSHSPHASPSNHAGWRCDYGAHVRRHDPRPPRAHGVSLRGCETASMGRGPHEPRRRRGRLQLDFALRPAALTHSGDRRTQRAPAFQGYNGRCHGHEHDY